MIEALKQLFVGSGAAWVLWLLVGLAVASLAVAIERALYFRGRVGDLAALARRLEDKLEMRDVVVARGLLSETRMVAASVADTGLKVAHLGPAAADKAMQGACAVERDRMEPHLAFLGTLGNNAPFVAPAIAPVKPCARNRASSDSGSRASQIQFSREAARPGSARGRCP